MAPGRPRLPVVTVLAATIVVAESGPSYRPVFKREPAKLRRARQLENAVRGHHQEDERRLTAGEEGGSSGDEGEPELTGGATSDEGSSDEDSGVSPLRNAVAQQAVTEGAATAAGTPPAAMLNPHGQALSDWLRYLRRRLRDYVEQQSLDSPRVRGTSLRGGGAILNPPPPPPPRR